MGLCVRGPGALRGLWAGARPFSALIGATPPGCPLAAAHKGVAIAAGAPTRGS